MQIAENACGVIWPPVGEAKRMPNLFGKNIATAFCGIRYLQTMKKTLFYFLMCANISNVNFAVKQKILNENK